MKNEQLTSPGAGRSSRRWTSAGWGEMPDTGLIDGSLACYAYDSANHEWRYTRDYLGRLGAVTFIDRCYPAFHCNEWGDDFAAVVAEAEYIGAGTGSGYANLNPWVEALAPLQLDFDLECWVGWRPSQARRDCG
jgi:hypothetical protein